MAERARVYPLRRELRPEPSSEKPPLQEPVLRKRQPREPLPREPQPKEPLPQEPLWREVLGQRLRTLRLQRRETLTETAGRAGISPQYLSEMERGRKEPSSEMIAAIAGALEVTLTELTEQVAGSLRRQRDIAMPRSAGPVMLSLAA